MPSPLQRTLILLKPDAVGRGLIGEILSRIERKANWRIVAMDLRTLDTATLERHYAEHVGKPFFGSLVGFMSSGPSVVVIVEGEHVIEGVRLLAGRTNPLEAGPGTVRGDFADTTQENLIHASDSEESAEREIEIFFPSAVRTDARVPAVAVD